MKRIVLITAALAMLAAAPIHAAGPFPDVAEGDWFCSYVRQARELGILAGYPDGTFKPARQVTYGEFLAMAMRGQSAQKPGTHWARGFYEAACESGVIGAADFSSRLLDEPIPRKDMALVMSGLLQAGGLGGIDAARSDLLFSDVSAEDPREYAIALCAHYGVLSGYPDGSFRPLGFLKRSEAAAAMTALDGVLKAAGAQGAVAVSQAGSTGKGSGEASGGAGQIGAGQPVSTAEPSTREELTDENREGYYEKRGETDVLSFMSETARRYLQEALLSARFENADGDLRVRISWPDLPEGFGVKFDVQLCDALGVGLDGKVWQMRSGMEKLPTYEKSLAVSGGAEYRFALSDLDGVGYARLLCVLTQEGESRESSSGLLEQDLAAGVCTVQYKVQTDTYFLSGTLPLNAAVFLWK